MQRVGHVTQVMHDSLIFLPLKPRLCEVLVKLLNDLHLALTNGMLIPWHLEYHVIKFLP